MNVDRSIRIAVDTGEATFGVKTTTNALLNKKAKLVILANNAPIDIEQDIKRYAKLAEIEVLQYQGSSLDLGATCGRPHFISTLAIIETGDSDILDVIEN